MILRAGFRHERTSTVGELQICLPAMQNTGFDSKEGHVVNANLVIIFCDNIVCSTRWRRSKLLIGSESFISPGNERFIAV